MNKVVILGGGFGGLYTALRLQELDWQGNPPEITLIDKNDRFLFSPLLYELITGEMQSWEVAPYYRDLLANTEINFIQDTATAVNLPQNTVAFQNHPTIFYDRLVVALGGTTPIDFVKGAKEFAIPFRRLDDASTLKQKLQRLEDSTQDYIRIAVVGAGYSGIELAVKLADRLGKRGKIRIIDRGSHILKNSPEFNRKSAGRALKSRNIWLNLETTVTEVKEKEIALEYRGTIDNLPVDIVLWTVGTKAINLLEGLDLPQNEQGKIIIDDKLQVQDYPHIFALGDLVRSIDSKGNVLANTAQVAFQQSDYCALNIKASLTHQPLSPFRYQPLGEMLALGVDNATLSGLGVSLDGNLAYIARRLVYLYRLPTLQHQLKVSLNLLLSPLTNLFG
ncbi:MAG: NAD(P)/FAD-dependent oxidoreductase [Cyanobacterium sp. T60_A2020_053]|nr:NAD(P)/FAD-dependent oxidoreductase [Cyanobacterium sp. T60_A2020_053]